MTRRHRSRSLTIAPLLLLCCLGCARGESRLWPSFPGGLMGRATGRVAACRATLAPERMSTEQAAPQAPLPVPLPPLPERLDGQIEEAPSWSDQEVPSASDLPSPTTAPAAPVGLSSPSGAPLAVHGQRQLDAAFTRLGQATQGMHPAALAPGAAAPAPRVACMPRRLPQTDSGIAATAPTERASAAEPAPRAANQAPATSPWMR